MSNTSLRRSRIALAAFAACGVLGLSACGSDSSDPASETSDPPSGPAAASVTLQGTAATGLAIAGQPVSAKCSGGDGSATTNDDGTYTITVEGDASLPCTLRVTTADGEVLHSLAMGTGNSARANITPVSELVVARLAGGNPAAFFDGFSAASARALTTESVQSAAASVVETLKAAGVDLGGFDLLGGDLVAATSAGATGNDFDRALDALGAALASSQTTLAQLAEAVAQTSSQSTQASSGVPSLPAEMLLKKAAANCPSFRSGTYRLLMPSDSETDARATTLVVDAAALSASFPTLSDAPASTTFVEDGHCKYVIDFDGNQGRLAVSAAGVGILSLPGDPGIFHAGLMFPEQTIPVSALAGDWNTLEWERADTTSWLAALSGEVTILPDGRLTNLTDCAAPRFEAASCALEGQVDERFQANASGGFDLVVDGTAEEGARLFAYRAGSGDLMLAMVDSTNTLIVGTPKRKLRLPAVGQKTGGLAMAIDPNGRATDGGAPGTLPTPGQFNDSNWTVIEVDAAAGTYVRENADGTVQQSFAIDSPREGFAMRQPGTGVSEMIFMPVRGTGLSALTSVVDPGSWGIFLLAVDKSEAAVR